MHRALTTLEEFDAAVASQAFVVIHDIPTRAARLHQLPCSAVRRQHFETKVVRNRGKTGRYDRFQSLDEATRSGAVPCSRCLGEGNRRSLEVWSEHQLDLQSKPPDPRGVLRQVIREKLRDMECHEGEILHASHHSPRILHRADGENILFTNIDPTGSLFRNLTCNGLIFEHIPADRRGSVYRMVPQEFQSDACAFDQPIATWESCDISSLSEATSCGPIWYDLRARVLRFINATNCLRFSALTSFCRFRPAVL